MALAEVRTLFPGRPIGCFVSIGIEMPRLLWVPGGSLFKIAEACGRLSYSCEKVHQSIKNHFCDTTPEGQENPYFRFSANGNIMFDDWERAEELTASSQDYLSADLEKKKVVKIVDALIAKSEWAEPEPVDSVVRPDLLKPETAPIALEVEVEQQIGPELEHLEPELEQIISEAERIKSEAERIKSEAERIKSEAERIKSEVEQIKSEAEQTRSEAEWTKLEAEPTTP